MQNSMQNYISKHGFNQSSSPKKIFLGIGDTKAFLQLYTAFHFQLIHFPRVFYFFSLEI